eukprot:m.39356 g.39356  ORF g.39356 m.39356 type:complete len:1062 (+) comp18174_c1_seq2:282-3467(+)
MDALSDNEELNAHNEADEATGQNFASVIMSLGSALKGRQSNEGPSETIGQGGLGVHQIAPTSPIPARKEPHFGMSMKHASTKQKVGTLPLRKDPKTSTMRPESLFRYGSTESLDQLDVGPIASGWFMKKAPTFKGSTKKRFLELHATEIQYFADERDGRGSSLKGSISLDSATTKAKVAGRQLCITTSERFWDLLAIEGEKKAQEWFDLIQEIVTADSEVDMLPGHGDYLTKRGKGLGKHTADKKRYFTLIYTEETSTVRLNYYVEIAGLRRIPINKKGFVAIDTSSQFIAKERVLEVINVGYTWHLTASSAEVASRWVRILTQIVREMKDLKDTAETTGAPIGVPVLAQASKLIQNCQADVDDLQRIFKELEEKNDVDIVALWKEEISNSFVAAAYIKALETNMLQLPDPAWFEGRSGAKPSKRMWYEIDGVQIKCYSKPPNGTLKNGDSMGDEVVGPSSLLPKGSILISSDTEVAYTTGAYDFALVCGNAQDRFVSDSVDVASTWAAALRATVDAFGQRSGGSAVSLKKKSSKSDVLELDMDDPTSDPENDDRMKRTLSVYKVKKKGAEGEDIKDITIIDRAKVLFEYNARNNNELSLVKDEVVSLLTAARGVTWWEGVVTRNGSLCTGWFPASYVSRLHLVRAKSMLLSLHDVYASSSSSSDEDEEDELDQNTKELYKRKKEKQAMVVQEIIKTEQNYVRDLFSMGKGYINPMRDPQQTAFGDDLIDVLFSNVEQLLQQQTTFLGALEKAKDNQALGISEAFLAHSAGFRQHSTYCSNHPRAGEELERLLHEDQQAWSFFEACRMLLDDASLSVSALMLKPVQRICQYPMLFDELKKTCQPDSKEFEITTQALHLAKEIALTINEEKRQKEEISLIFDKFDNWKGPHLTVYSSTIFIEGNLRKISGQRSQNRYFFLFDNLLVIARKHNISGRFHVYATMFTQGCVCESVADGEYTHGKTKISNAFRVFNIEKQRWYVLIAKSCDEKALWIEAFKDEKVKRSVNAEIGMSMLDMSSQEIGIGHGRKSVNKGAMRKTMKTTTLKRPAQRKTTMKLSTSPR